MMRRIALLADDVFFFFLFFFSFVWNQISKHFLFPFLSWLEFVFVVIFVVCKICVGVGNLRGNTRLSRKIFFISSDDDNERREWMKDYQMHSTDPNDGTQKKNVHCTNSSWSNSVCWFTGFLISNYTLSDDITITLLLF